MTKAKYPDGVFYRLRHDKGMSWGALKKDTGMTINEMRYRINRYLIKKGKEFLRWKIRQINKSFRLMRKVIPDDWSGEALYRQHYERGKSWGMLSEESGLSRNKIQYRINKYLKKNGRAALWHERYKHEREQQGLLQRIFG